MFWRVTGLIKKKPSQAWDSRGRVVRRSETRRVRHITGEPPDYCNGCQGPNHARVKAVVEAYRATVSASLCFEFPLRCLAVFPRELSQRRSSGVKCCFYRPRAVTLTQTTGHDV